MIDETKIRGALAADAEQIAPPPDLLERIERKADRPLRLSLWARLAPKLELAAACLLVASLIGVAAYRQAHQNQSAGGGPPVVVPEGSVPEGPLVDGPDPAPPAQAYFGDATDLTLRAELKVERLPDGQWSIRATFQNLSTTDLAVHGGCHLVSITGLEEYVHSCPLVHLPVPVGETAQTQFTLPQGGQPDVAFVEYGHLGSDSGRSLALPLRPGQRITFSETASLLLALKEAGLATTAPEELPTPLFGAKQMQRIGVAGGDVMIYTFDGIVSADHGWQTMTDPSKNTVSWARNPQFMQLGEAIVQISTGDPVLVERIKRALFDLMQHQPLSPERSLPTLESVKRAYIPGGAKLPDRYLTIEMIRKVTTMLQTAEPINDGESPLYSPRGPNPPLTLFLELRDGDAVQFRRANDCIISASTGGAPQSMTCTESTVDVLLFERGRMRRLRAPDLAQWLAGGWREDVPE